MDRKKARKIINETRYINEYKYEIIKLERELSKLDETYKLGPTDPKGPMDWDRVQILKRDGTYEDMRYKSPGSKYPVHDHRALFDYEDDLHKDLEYNRLALERAERFYSILTDGEDSEFMKDYISGDKTLTYLTRTYGYTNPHTRAVTIVSQKLGKFC